MGAGLRRPLPSQAERARVAGFVGPYKEPPGWPGLNCPRRATQRVLLLVLVGLPGWLSCFSRRWALRFTARSLRPPGNPNPSVRRVTGSAVPGGGAAPAAAVVSAARGAWEGHGLRGPGIGGGVLRDPRPPRPPPGRSSLWSAQQSRVWDPLPRRRLKGQ